MKETKDSPRSILFQEIFDADFCVLLAKSNILQSFREMVAACLVKDPKKRPSSEKLLKHPFFKHARSADYLSSNILHGLSSLGERFRMLKVTRSSHSRIYLPFILQKWNCV